MSERREKLKKMLERLEQERDELKMKLGLAKLEAREEWQEVNEKIQGLRGRLGVLKEEAGDVGEDVGAALDMAADEIREGIARLRKLL